MKKQKKRKSNDKKAAKYIQKLLAGDICEINLTIRYRETAPQSEKDMFVNTIRRINRQRSRSGKPRLQYRMELDGRVVQSSNFSPSIPSNSTSILEDKSS